MMINVLVNDMPGITQEGFRYVIEQSGRIKVIGFTDTIEDLLEVCGKFKVDIIIIGNKTETNGQLGYIKTIKQRSNSKIIVLISPDQIETYLPNAIINGVNGYLLYDITAYNLELAITCVMAGMTVINDKIYENLSSTIATYKYIINNYYNKKCHKYSNLSKKEMRIIKLITEGYSNKDIAKILYLSEGTIRNKITEIFIKVGVKDRVQLAVVAISDILPGSSPGPLMSEKKL